MLRVLAELMLGKYELCGNDSERLTYTGGSTAAADDLSFDDPALDRLYGEAGMLDAQGARSFIAGYDGTTAVPAYASGFMAAYGAARTGKSQDQARMASPYAAGLPAASFQYAYAAGENARSGAGQDAGPKYSIRYDSENRPYVEVDEDILAGVPRKDWVKTVRGNLAKKFPNGVTVGNNVIEINAKSWGEMTYSKYTQRLMRNEPGLFADKMRATHNADEILRASRNYINEAPMHPRKDNIQQFARGEVQLRIGSNEYTAQVVVAMRPNGNLLMYDILNIQETNINKKDGHSNTKNPLESETGRRAVPTDSVPQKGKAVNSSIRGEGEKDARLGPAEINKKNRHSNRLYAEARSGESAVPTDSVPQKGKAVNSSIRREGAKDVRPGLTRAYQVDKLTEAAKAALKKNRVQLKLIDYMARRYGVEVVLTDTLKGMILGGTVIETDANGLYDPESGKIYLSVTAQGGAFAYVAMHEMAHYIRAWNREGYKALQRAVQAALEANGQDVEALARYQMEQFGYDEEAALEEVVANSLPAVLADEGFVRELTQTNRRLAMKVQDFLHDLVKNLKDALDKLAQSRSWKQMAALREDLDSLRDMERAFTAAMEGTTDREHPALDIKTEPSLMLSQKEVDGKAIAWIDNHPLTNKQLRDPKAVAALIAEHIGEVYTIIESGQKVYIGKDLPREYTRSRYSSYLRNNKAMIYQAKNRLGSGLGDLIRISTNRRWEPTRHSHNKDAKYGMYRYSSTFGFAVRQGEGSEHVRVYDVELIIRNASDGRKYLYDIVNIKENAAVAYRLQEARLAAARPPHDAASSINNIPSDLSQGKVKFSQKDIENLREADVETLLENASNGAYHDGSYIPLRRNTPQALMEILGQHSGEAIEDLPVIMNVGKVRQAMEEGEYAGGRGHGISREGMMAIIKGMDDPAYIVEQENGRYVEVVRYYDGQKRAAWAVLDFGNFKRPQHMNGYEGGQYHVLVTAFEPDNLKHYLSGHGNKILYDKRKDALQSGSGRLWPSHLNRTPFADSIPPEAGQSKKEPKFSQKDIESLREADVETLLENASNGAYHDGSYIPLRRNTPQALMEILGQHSGEAIEDLPVIMNVGKVRQAMEEGEYAGGRGHGISREGMMAIIKGMDDPAYIVEQENGRYVEVVRYYDGQKRAAWAVLDFGNLKNAEYMNGYEGGQYHVLVTAFEPDNLKRYLSHNVREILYDKRKDALQRGSGRLWPSHLNRTPFADSIPSGQAQGKEKPKFSLKEGMTEGERYEALKDAELQVPRYDGEASKLTEAEAERLARSTRRDARRYAKTLYEKFGLGKQYVNRAADIEFEFSGRGIDKSIHEENERGARFDHFGKMLATFDAIIENAIPLEIHGDKYRGTRREDPLLERVYVLVSAYEDGGIVPIQLEVKEYREQDNQLYVAVTLNKIETGVPVTAQHFQHEAGVLPYLALFQPLVYANYSQISTRKTGKC